jgi:hypothetical protein
MASSSGAPARRLPISRRRKVHEDNHRVFIVALFVWAGCVLWGEALCFTVYSWRCSWPGAAPAARVLVIADPQLTDRGSYGMHHESKRLQFVEYVSDLYMKRAYRAVLQRHRPDHVVFLGTARSGLDPSASLTLSRHHQATCLTSRGPWAADKATSSTTASSFSASTTYSRSMAARAAST